MQTLIQRQEQAIAEMMEGRTSAKREAKHRKGVAHGFHRQSVAMGYTAEQAKQQVQDIYDMYRLRACAEE